MSKIDYNNSIENIKVNKLNNNTDKNSSAYSLSKLSSSKNNSITEDPDVNNFFKIISKKIDSTINLNKLGYKAEDIKDKTTKKINNTDYEIIYLDDGTEYWINTETNETKHVDRNNKIYSKIPDELIPYINLDNDQITSIEKKGTVNINGESWNCVTLVSNEQNSFFDFYNEKNNNFECQYIYNEKTGEAIKLSIGFLVNYDLKDIKNISTEKVLGKDTTTIYLKNGRKTWVDENNTTSSDITRTFAAGDYNYQKTIDINGNESYYNEKTGETIKTITMESVSDKIIINESTKKAYGVDTKVITLKNGTQYWVDKNGKLVTSIETKCERNGEQYNVYLYPNGTEYWYNSKSGKITWGINRDKDIYTHYKYNLTEEEKQSICDLYGLDSSTPINYIAESKIRGHSIKFHSFGDNEKTSNKVPERFANLYSEYSDETLSDIEKNLAGIILSPWRYNPYWDKGTTDGGMAYTSGDKEKGYYIYLPTDYQTYDYEKKEYIYEDAELNEYYEEGYSYSNGIAYHEMGHVIKSINEDKKIFDSKRNYELYEKYGEKLSQLSSSRYSSKFAEFAPNSDEFFADACTNYYMKPDELKSNIPELYEYLNNMYKKYESLTQNKYSDF